MKQSKFITLFMITFLSFGTVSASNIQSINISPPDFADAKKTKEMTMFFNDLLGRSMPNKLKHIRLIEPADIKDAINKKYYEEQTWFSFVQDDFNLNGFEDVALACIDDNNSYVAIFEKRKGRYNLIKYYTFNRSDIFVKFMTRKNIIADRPYDLNKLSVGFQGDTDNGVTIKWINNEYILIDQFED